MRPDEGWRHAPGRGAYLCPNRSCWERGLRGALGGALRTTLTDADRERLRAFADGLDHDTDPAVASTGGTSDTDTAPAEGATEGEEA